MTEITQSLAPRMTLIAGNCVIESESLAMETAVELKRQLKKLDVEFYFKASFDKANRSSVKGFRGPGMKEGLRILEKIKGETGLKILTDVHTVDQVEPVAAVADFIQIPAFLCRQTDLVVESARAALNLERRLNIKKGQFLAPWDTLNIINKVRAEYEFLKSNNSQLHRKKDWFCLTERGVSFGYNNLTVDMSGFQVMQQFGVPVIYDATHSVQIPGGGPGGEKTGGKRQFIEVLARAAMAAGADGMFLECHPQPSEAKSDADNAFPLEHVGEFVAQALRFRQLAIESPKILPESRGEV